MTRFRHLNRSALIATAGLMLSAFATPALANSSSSAAQSRPSAAEQREAPEIDGRGRICVRAKFTGSRLARRICKTAAEWDAEGGVPASER